MVSSPLPSLFIIFTAPESISTLDLEFASGPTLTVEPNEATLTPPCVTAKPLELRTALLEVLPFALNSTDVP